MRDLIREKMEEFVMEELGTSRRLPMDIYGKVEAIGIAAVCEKMSRIGLVCEDDAVLSILKSNVDLDDAINDAIETVNASPYMVLEIRTSKLDNTQQTSKIVATCSDGDLDEEIEYYKKRFGFYEYYNVEWKVVKFNKETGELE